MRSCHQCGLRYSQADAYCPADGAALTDSDDALLGSIVGNYRVVRPLGEGGMGRVYLGLHPRIGSRVAIKVLAPEASSDEDLVHRFFAEATLVNKIHHEAIVNVLDLDHLEDGRPYIIMELLDGEHLGKVLARGPMSVGLAVSMGVEVLEALVAAHRVGVVHRDLKPENIFVTPKGRVKILDFGIAKLLPEFQTRALGLSTQTGALLGTPAYMAPEQVVGDGVSAATDLYAVGAVLYEALTGCMPFQGKTLFELLRQIVSDAPAAPSEYRSELAGPLQSFLLKALAKRPQERFSSAESMAAELDAIRRGLGEEAWKAPPARPRASSVSGTDSTMAATERQRLAMGSEATVLASGKRSLDVASAATMLATDDLAMESEMFAETLAAEPHSPIAEGRLLREAPNTRSGVSAPDCVPMDAPSRHPSFAGSPGDGRKQTPWLLGFAVLAVWGVAALVFLSSRDSKPRTRTAAETSLDAGAPKPESDAAASVPAAGAEELPLDDDSRRASKESARRASPASRHRRKTATGASSAPSSLEKRDRPPPSSTSGVTIIETAGRHPESTIYRPPDFSVRSFDGAAYLPKAYALAKEIYPDARLTEFDVEGVASNGKSNLSIANFEAAYRFLSPSHAKRTTPIGAKEDRPCWVDVEVNKGGVTAEIVEGDRCKDNHPPRPKCSLRQVWERSATVGTHADKAGAVAHISYLSDGQWFFRIDALGITGSILDDC